MKLATWNVNGIRSVLNKGALQEYVLESNPDIYAYKKQRRNKNKWNLEWSLASMMCISTRR